MKKTLLIILLLLPAMAFAQRGAMKYDNKVIINDNSSDALTVTGGIMVSGDITLSGKLKIGSSVLQFPTLDGSAGQFLQTDGNGNLSWVTVSSGGPFSTVSNVTSNSGGTLASDDFVFGSSQLNDDENSDHDSRMFFDKSKSAFRVGYESSQQWDEANLGTGSFAAGQEVKASGNGSVALGLMTRAMGTASFAGGANTSTNALYAFAYGYNTQANGNMSFASGSNISANSISQATFGSYNTVISGSANTWVATDPLFVIGNGQDSDHRSDALIIQKNGNATIYGTLGLSNGSSTYTLPNYDGSFGQALVTDGNGSLTWTTIGGSSQAFSTTSNITSNTGGDYSADNFVFGSPSLNSDGNSDHNRRMFFEKSTGTFRAGYASSTEWDSRGSASVAFGYRTEAPGDQSAAWGNRSKSIGAKSTAFGYRSEARKDYSTAWGYFTYADSYMETVFGQYNTEVEGNAGWVTSDRLLVIGNGTSVERSDALVILKNGNTTIKGTLNLSNGSSSYTLPNSDGTNGQILTTNGSGIVNWADASGGGSGAFSTTSNVTSNAGGTLASDDFVFGSSQLADDTNTDHDSRMFFDKSNAAFRVGAATETQWDSENVALYSFGAGYNVTATGAASVAFGGNTTASGDVSAAFGFVTTASGENSAAFGDQTTASGKNSAAFGGQTTASGSRSAAFGDQTTASGSRSAAFGDQTTASGIYATVFGHYNTSDSYAQFTLGQNAVISGGSNNSWVATDPLFVIGNGIGPLNRSNAMTVLKNGNTAINGTLSLSNGSSTYTLPNSDGTNGQVLTTNGSGNVSWQTPSGGGSSGIQVAILRETGTDGNDNGTYTAGSWVQRPVDTEIDPSNIVSISSGDFTLQAGTYLIEADIQLVQVGGCRAKLYNVTNTSDEAYSLTGYSADGNHADILKVTHILTITTATTYDFRVRGFQSGSNGWELGTQDYIAGTQEYYSTVKITKLD